MLHAGGIALVKDLWGIRIFSVEFQAKVRGKLFACMIAVGFFVPELPIGSVKQGGYKTVNSIGQTV